MINKISQFLKKKETPPKNKSNKDIDFKTENFYFSVCNLMGENYKKNECQDSYCILDNYGNELIFFGVFDGHGESGREISNTVSDFIQNHIEYNKNKLTSWNSIIKTENFLKNMIKLVKKKLKVSGIELSISGTTCNCVLILDNIIYILNIGDSKSILYRNENDQKILIELSIDHKPNIKAERDRIYKNKGIIEKLKINNEPYGPFRVWEDLNGPGLSMTRSLGDYVAKKIGVSDTPDIQRLETRIGDKFIICATDGLWDVFNFYEICNFLDNLINSTDSNEYDNISTILGKKAQELWKNKYYREKKKFKNLYLEIDDITIIILIFKNKNLE